MTRFGKRILSAFVDVGEEKKQPAPGSPAAADAREGADKREAPAPKREGTTTIPPGTEQRFAGYFDKLFSDANIPGPDYYEFARMIGAMQSIPDERARYAAAFAGLQAQGLDKEKLLSTANEYLRVLDADAGAFQKTVQAAMQEKVTGRSAEAEEKNGRIQALSQEILELQRQIEVLQREIGGNKEKLEASSSGYTAEGERRRQQIRDDIGKINHYL